MLNMRILDMVYQINWSLSYSLVRKRLYWELGEYRAVQKVIL